jgi:hypothetical protein
MRKLFLTLFSFSFYVVSFSQIDSVSHFGGVYTKLNSANSFEGSPLLFNIWKRGEVKLMNDQKFVVEKLNLDASKNTFEYESNDSVYEFTNNIKEVRIYGEDHDAHPELDTIFRTDINPSATNFVHVLIEGKITIFCEYNKKLEGENSINGFVATTAKYELYSNYFAVINKKATPIKFNSSTLDDLTSDKKTEVEAYIKENKLKVKKEPDFLKAINFYNSIGS